MENPRLHTYLTEWLSEATIDDMQTKMANGELSSRELVLLYMERIATVDKKLKSVIEINPHALQIAEALDRERAERKVRGPMHGIPVLIKDNIDTGDMMHTSAGSLALANSYANEDATVARLLRESGAVLLGKTNMTEWANFMSDRMPSGYSSRGGQVLNPYGPGRFDVGGSSAGSGAAIAANLAAVAVGTETSGSILNPASQNSLVGVKPTVGLVSRKGIIPIAHTQDTAGPMARTVRDAAILLNVMNVADADDPITLSNPLLGVDFVAALAADGLRGARIGVARNGFFDQLNADQLKHVEQAITKLRDCGAEIVDAVEIPSTTRNWGYEVLTYEFKPGLNAYLKNLSPAVQVRTLKDVVAFNEADPERMLKYGQAVMIESEATSGTLTEETYLKALCADQYYSKEQGIDYVLSEHHLDAILFPHDFGSEIPAKAGYPSVAVPAGYAADGEPIGIMFTGTAFSEPTLLKLAYAYEQATKHRIAPEIE